MPTTSSSTRSRLFVVLLLSLALAATACTRPRPLVDPKPLAGATTPEQTRVAILRALAHNNWILESEKQGEIVASYSRSDWTMVVEIAYANEVSIRYVSSENLSYGKSEAGTPVIHRGYNMRVQRLSKEIGTEIMLARAIDNTPPVAAPPPAPAAAPTQTSE